MLARASTHAGAVTAPIALIRIAAFCVQRRRGNFGLPDCWSSIRSGDAAVSYPLRRSRRGGGLLLAAAQCMTSPCGSASTTGPPAVRGQPGRRMRWIGTSILTRGRVRAVDAASCGKGLLAMRVQRQDGFKNALLERGAALGAQRQRRRPRRRSGRAGCRLFRSPALRARFLPPDPGASRVGALYNTWAAMQCACSAVQRPT